MGPERQPALGKALREAADQELWNSTSEIPECAVLFLLIFLSIKEECIRNSSRCFRDSYSRLYAVHDPCITSLETLIFN